MARWLIPLLSLVLVPVAAGAQGSLSAELCRAVARAWSLPASEVEALAAESGTDLSNLAVAAMLAKSTGKGIRETWRIHAAEPTWAEAFAKAGLNPSTVIAGVEGRLSPPRWEALLGKGEPVAMAALVRTLERLTGRAPEPLARELARKSFPEYFAELAGVETAPSPEAPSATSPGQVESLGLAPVEAPSKLVMPVPGFAPPHSGSQAPPASVAATPR